MAATMPRPAACRCCHEATTAHPSGYCETCFLVIEDTHGDSTCRGCKEAASNLLQHNLHDLFLQNAILLFDSAAQGLIKHKEVMRLLSSHLAANTFQRHRELNPAIVRKMAKKQSELNTSTIRTITQFIIAHDLARSSLRLDREEISHPPPFLRSITIGLFKEYSKYLTEDDKARIERSRKDFLEMARLTTRIFSSVLDLMAQ